jgi:GxxExxY protein
VFRHKPEWPFVGAGGVGRVSPDDEGMKRASEPPGHTFEPLSYAVLGACIDVQRQLGVHCMEVDYQRALELALSKRGLAYEREVEVPVEYDGQLVTKRRVDFVIWDETHELILETKALSAILDEDIEQCLLYLHRGGYRICLLVNFGEKPIGRRRFVHTPMEKLGA